MNKRNGWGVAVQCRILFAFAGAICTGLPLSKLARADANASMMLLHEIPLIVDAAKDLCKDVAASGSDNSTTISATIDAGLDKLLRNLARADAKLDVIHKADVHTGTLQADLPLALQNENVCRTHTFDALLAALQSALNSH